MAREDWTWDCLVSNARQTEGRMEMLEVQSTLATRLEGCERKGRAAKESDCRSASHRELPLSSQKPSKGNQGTEGDTRGQTHGDRETGVTEKPVQPRPELIFPRASLRFPRFSRRVQAGRR